MDETTNVGVRHGESLEQPADCEEKGVALVGFFMTKTDAKSLRAVTTRPWLTYWLSHPKTAISSVINNVIYICMYIMVHQNVPIGTYIKFT